jgi:hypothetical protein
MSLLILVCLTAFLALVSLAFLVALLVKRSRSGNQGASR